MFASRRRTGGIWLRPRAGAECILIAPCLDATGNGGALAHRVRCGAEAELVVEAGGQGFLALEAQQELGELIMQFGGRLYAKRD